MHGAGRMPAPELQRLQAGHGPAVLAFEVANRAYFAASISDRGDDWFEQFDARHDEMLADQATGRGAYFVLVDPGGAVIGRFNLFRIGEGTAELGYRVGEDHTGRGVATTAVKELCRVAATDLGLRTLRARTTGDNLASQRVLLKAGFVPTGPTEIGGRAATSFERDLTGPDPGI